MKSEGRQNLDEIFFKSSHSLLDPFLNVILSLSHTLKVWKRLTPYQKFLLQEEKAFRNLPHFMQEKVLKK